MKQSKYLPVVIDFVSTNAGQLRKTVPFTANSCQLFFNAQHLLLKLSTKDRAFFDYLCEVMRPVDNDVYIDDNLKAGFIAHVARFSSSKVKLTKAMVSKSVLQLKSLGLILPTDDKARYVVNPKYVFKGSVFQRKRFLKQLIEHRITSKLPIAALLNEPEDTFLSGVVKEKK